MLRVELAGEEIGLSHERAMWWPARRTLIVADLHFGKAATFRSAGVPVPEGTTAIDLGRLDRLIAATDALRLVLLGDLLHARAGRGDETMDTITAWRNRHAGLDMLLVRGNHDRRAGDPPARWRTECVDNDHIDGPFSYCHEPQTSDHGYVLCGHIHPAAVLEGRGSTRMRSACFWFGADQGVLPAFGSFTGMKPVRPVLGDRLFVVGPDEVVEAAVMARPSRSPSARY